MDPAPRIGMVSLGCPKALVDTERILTQLRTDGYEIVPTYQDAALVIVNTCGFIDEAKAESLDAIGEALDENGRVIVTGCLGAKRREIEAAHPAVLAVTGPQAYEAVVEHVHQHVPIPAHDPYTSLVPPQGIKLTPRHYAYLKISEGCNHHCTFCIIPSMRGKLASRPAGDVLLPLMAEDKLLPYLDIPFQHGSPRILKSMRRPAAAENTLARIEKWRSIRPDIAIRSTFIVGFPGETEADFDELLSFLESAQLDRVGCFEYSAVEGARANDLPDPVPEEVKAERFERFMTLQAGISEHKLKARVGTRADVIIDEVREDAAIGRSKMEAPDIDGLIHIRDPGGLSPGTIVSTVIEDSDEHDLWARRV